MKEDRICPKCKSNKKGFNTFVNRRDMMSCGNCNHIFNKMEYEVEA